MLLRILITSCALVLNGQAVLAQNLEERVARLESQVAELWSAFQEQAFDDGFVPAELVGNEHMRWGYPGGDCAVLVNDYFITCHDNAKRIPEWVTYHLTSENVAGHAERTDDFRPDPQLPEGARAELADYAGSGYDRGHMAPAAAFKRSAEAMSRTFLLSNMAPQTASLNRELWRLLEDEVRELASAASSIWVFTGSLFLDENGFPTEPDTFIGDNRVAVPTHFYKVILAADGAGGAYGASRTAVSGALELFAFVMANQMEQLSGTPGDYLVSVDLVEFFSGLDFFSALSDSTEVALEEQTAGTWPRG
jgi:endonuclease G